MTTITEQPTTKEKVNKKKTREEIYQELSKKYREKWLKELEENYIEKVYYPEGLE